MEGTTSTQVCKRIVTLSKLYYILPRADDPTTISVPAQPTQSPGLNSHSLTFKLTINEFCVILTALKMGSH